MLLILEIDVFLIPPGWMIAHSFTMPILLKSLLFGKQNLREETLEISGQTLLAAPPSISCHCNREKNRYNAFVAYAAVERRETHIQEDRP